MPIYKNEVSVNSVDGHDKSEMYTYLINKYKEQNLLDSSGNIMKSESGFDFNIYPDTGYIPPCSICKNMYTTFIATNNHKINSKHNLCGCLWFDYYKNKIIIINPNAIFNNK